MKKIFLSLLVSISAAGAMAQNVGIGTPNPQEQLHTTGTVRFENYSGNGTRLVQMDPTGKLVVSPVGTVQGNSTTAAIPDNGCTGGTGAGSTITVSGAPLALLSSNIAVRVNITHTYTADLQLYLIAPNGQTLCLSKNAGGSGDNYTNTIFTDVAATTTASGAAPFTGSFKPLGGAITCFSATGINSFSAIGSGSIIPNGNWTLRVFDDNGQDAGILTSWFISFTGGQSLLSQSQDNYLSKFSNANLVSSNVYQSETNGNIGIGTTSPLYPLHVTGELHTDVNASINGLLKVTGGEPGFGKVLTDTTGTGTAKWKALPSANSGFRLSPQLASTPPGTYGINGAATNTDDFNDGNNWNGVMFTAPANGVYYFEISIAVTGGAAANNGLIGVAIRKQAMEIAMQRSNITAGVAVDCAVSVSTIIKLTAGQLVDFTYTQTLFQTLTMGRAHIAGYRIY